MTQPTIRNVLLVVAKRPAPGRTKTRLTPPLDPEQAAALYECFLLDTLDLVRRVHGVQPVIAYLPETERSYFTDLAPGFDLLLQEGENLGIRLHHALAHYLHDGFRHAVIMNSDGPNLPLRHLTAAFEALEGGADVVLGPCYDGGYYLIGLSRPAPRLLCEVRMSTPHVLVDTLALAAEESLEVAMLPAWYDVDNEETLRQLQADLKEAEDGVARNTREWLRRTEGF